MTLKTIRKKYKVNIDINYHIGRKVDRVVHTFEDGCFMKWGAVESDIILPTFRMYLMT